MKPASDPNLQDDECSSASQPSSQDDDLRERASAAIAFLESVVADRARLSVLCEEERRRLLVAAGQVARPGPWAKRELAREARRRRKRAQRERDELTLAQTGIRQKRQEPAFKTPIFGKPPVEPGDSIDERLAEETRPRVDSARRCYVCKAEFFRLHHFYDSMCSPCAELNWHKRHQSADLRGRYALVTGARVKIGYQAAIMLLRAGAHVVVTTRFPRDAAERYAREPDFDKWRTRLDIVGLDLRHTPSVEVFCRHLRTALPSLDFILNNACQTVRKPPGFYAHLVEDERRPLRELAEPVRATLGRYQEMLARVESAESEAIVPGRQGLSGLCKPADLSQQALLAEDMDTGPQLFPRGQLDADLQQVDLRGRNSWRLALDEVSAIELLEVQLVNAVAPFILSARLKPLMMKTPTRDKHIVNVSAMEGQFYRSYKTDKHPHTNMAKAALNMMTRTSAVDYARDGIHMNSVDTGWITDEDPAEIAARKVEEHGFHPPLDIVDGAARICDPIFDGFATGVHRWGLFFKDYGPAAW